MSQHTSTPELRAAGTDLSERRRSGISRGPLSDIAPEPHRIGITAEAGGTRIGALTTIAAVGADPGIIAGYPGLAAAANGLATPQIRAIGTIGGNIAQRSRCWYFRSPHIGCLKKGGDSCPARGGNHLYGVAFDLGPCVAPHPSTLAAALLAYEARIDTNRRRGLTVGAVLGDGRDGRRDNQLESGEIIEAILLPAPVMGERAFYKRAISRTYAEWPLVELCLRVVIDDGVVRLARMTAGGIAPVPLQLAAAEKVLEGASLSADTIARAAQAATVGAKALPMTGYKLSLLSGLVQDLLEQAGR